MTLTLVNLFTVEPEEEESFVARFKENATRLGDLPGFGGTNLHINSGVGDQTYRFVNIATWESAEAWQAALPKILEGVSAGRAIPKAALYESIFRLPGGGRN